MPELKRSPLLAIGKDITDEMINPENIKLFKKYVRDMQMRELSQKTIYSYECDIKAWFRYICQEQFNQSVKELTEDDIEEMIFMCKEYGNNTERIRRRLASISAFYKFLRKKKEVVENPCEFIARPKKSLPVVVQTFLTKDEWSHMKEELLKYNNLQLTTYVFLSMSTMARVNAISNIKWKQIDFDKRKIIDVLEKENKVVKLYFNKEVKYLLLRLKDERIREVIDNEYVFISKYNGEYGKVSVNTLSDWARKAGELIGINTIHPHDFRHSGATLLKNEGMSLEKVSHLLSHDSVEVTRKHYIRENEDEISEDKDKYEI